MIPTTGDTAPETSRRRLLGTLAMGLACATAGCSVEDVDPEPDDAAGDTTSSPTPTAATEPTDTDPEAPSETATSPEAQDSTETGVTEGDVVPIEALSAGDLVINEVMVDPTTTSDSDGEWFELYIPPPDPIALDGLVIRSGGTDSHTVAGLGTAEPDAYLVFASNAGRLEELGIQADYEYDGVSFANLGDELVVDNGTTVIDGIEWDDGATWPDAPGRSFSLDPAFKNASDNDDGANWFPAETALGEEDYGTPGAPNPDDP